MGLSRRLACAQCLHGGFRVTLFQLRFLPGTEQHNQFAGFWWCGAPAFSIDGYGDIANYLAIGNDDQWPVKKPLKSRLITKDNDRFLLFEDPDSEIHWMEPKYLGGGKKRPAVANC